MRKLSLAAVILALAAPAAAEEVPARGDAQKGQELFRLECATCHGADARGAVFWKRASHGKGLGEVPDLRDAAYLAQASDAQLRKAIRKGIGRNGWIPGHAFAESLSSLDTWDLVQWLRDGNLSVAEFYPEAAKFTAKDFTIDEHGVKRLDEGLGLKLGKDQQTVVVLTIYKGKKRRGTARLVPWTPVELDLLKADDRLGFLVFTELALPGEKSPVQAGIAIGRDGKISKIRLKHPDAKKRAEHEKALAAFVGQGEKRVSKLKPPKGVKNADKYASVLTAAVGRATEGITMYDKSERERTAFDAK